MKRRSIICWSGWAIFIFVTMLLLGVLTFLYGVEFQKRTAHRPFLFRSPGLLIAAAAHCASVTVFAWIVAGWARTLLTRALCGKGGEKVQPDGHFSAVERRNFLLAYSTFLAALAPFWGLAVGYRVYRGGHIGTIFLFLLLAIAPLPRAVRRAVSAGNRGWRQFGRSVARVSIMLMVLPCVAVFQPAFDFGRKRLEADIGISRLARDCETLYGDCTRTSTTGWVDIPSNAMPTIGRLKPTWVHVHQKGLRIELHGGHDHYGYVMIMNAENTMWNLVWTDGGPGWDEVLYSWPVTAPRIDLHPAEGASE